MDFTTLKLAYNKGYFLFSERDKLSIVCNAPNDAGIFLIYAVNGQEEELVFVGGSGSISQNGDIGANTLKYRILIRRDGTDREKFLLKKMKSDHVNHFKIEWYNTFTNKKGLIPKFAEASVIQEFFSMKGILPAWNKEY